MLVFLIFVFNLKLPFFADVLLRFLKLFLSRLIEKDMRLMRRGKMIIMRSKIM